MAQQRLMRGQRATLTPGDPLARVAGHYGKQPPAPSPLMAPGATDPTDGASSDAPLGAIRGGAGGVRKHVRSGGVKPGKARLAPGDF